MFVFLLHFCSSLPLFQFYVKLHSPLIYEHTATRTTTWEIFSFQHLQKVRQPSMTVNSQWQGNDFDTIYMRHWSIKKKNGYSDTNIAVYCNNNNQFWFNSTDFQTRISYCLPKRLISWETCGEGSCCIQLTLYSIQLRRTLQDVSKLQLIGIHIIQNQKWKDY